MSCVVFLIEVYRCVPQGSDNFQNCPDEIWPWTVMELRDSNFLSLFACFFVFLIILWMNMVPFINIQVENSKYLRNKGNIAKIHELCYETTKTQLRNFSLKLVMQLIHRLFPIDFQYSIHITWCSIHSVGRFSMNQLIIRRIRIGDSPPNYCTTN